MEVALRYKLLTLLTLFTLLTLLTVLTWFTLLTWFELVTLFILLMPIFVLRKFRTLLELTNEVLSKKCDGGGGWIPLRLLRLLEHLQC